MSQVEKEITGWENEDGNFVLGKKVWVRSGIESGHPYFKHEDQVIYFDWEGQAYMMNEKEFQLGRES